MPTNNPQDVEEIMDTAEAKLLHASHLEYSIQQQLGELATLKGDLYVEDVIKKTWWGGRVMFEADSAGYNRGWDERKHIKPV